MTGTFSRRRVDRRGEMATAAETFVRRVGTGPLVQGLVGGLVIALLNTLGAAAILVVRDPSERALDALLGFAAGVMLSASFTGLLLPGIEFVEQPAHQSTVAGVTLAGIVPRPSPAGTSTS